MSRTISERLARLKRLRGSLARDVAALDVEIAALEVELRAAGFKPRKEAARPNAARLNEGTVGDAAETVLRQAKKPMRLTAIVLEIERRGLYRTNSKNLRSTLATALKRERRFERVGHGLYRWCPGPPLRQPAKRPRRQ